MKITRFVRIQLIIFAIVTVIAMVAMAIYYIRVPSMFGVGSYRVELNLPSSGGLYENANVSFRGVNVGKVKAVRLTDEGVQAELTIDNSAQIPESAKASVRSVSAIGEQFVEFTPPPGGGEGATLHDGSQVSSRDVPVEISSMLDQADALLQKVGDTKLRSLMDEAFTAFNGTGEALQRLLDSMALFVDEANKNTDTTISLVDQGGQLLATQSRTADDIRAWTRDVTAFTDQLRANRPEITDILDKGPTTVSDSEQLFASMNESWPMLVSNLGVVAKTQAVYLPNMRQILVIYPRLIAALITALNSGSVRYGPNVNFSLGFQDRPPCNIGFLPADQWRFPSAQNARELPPGMLCRVPQNSNMAVRGARNYPCVEFPGRRAPTPAECRTGYKPLPGSVDPFQHGLPFGLKWEAQRSGNVTPGTPSSYSPEPAVYATTYDPVSGDFIGPDGKTYNAGTGTKSQGQGGSWQSLITGTVGK
ncbi:virulence factor Mce family protein [Gordonia bronchialis DSM 43247]|uniref:Virulence factor Mce family protein n=1 Tax=Gordonia bronchialis (strain ATCC 25592 / DSM 43247 / BCRC 13721 / JCM 3198 / KCTC 3076 / NBRC 16047 / NCTC 10667) TaxID=526226 RepID=D0L3W6_GORB4|nr:MlaD family protein [Gordonia bronchialis]ACY23119.1 virulence factor Mce family protein [Gordonia bronchialis DSM 43247]MCC3325900.1 MCE family protein [Gordonia bronchialis]QGS23474.1 MCE family protein [Gordonia bronchialis]STQ66076.1 virulence factor Mce family protein [Gordonia bronchialis]